MLEALTRSAGRSVMAANPFLWDRFLRRTVPVPPLFGEFAHLAPTEVVSGGTPSAKSTPVKASISLLAASAVEAKVAGCVSDILGKEVAINEPLIDAGLDSLGAVELRDAVNAAVDMELPSTVVFDYPSVGAMSGFIVSQMHPEGEAGTEIVDQPVVVRSSEQRETLGGGRLVKSHLARRSARGQRPRRYLARPPRAVVLDASDDTAHVQARFGSFVADADMFDSEVFNVSATEGVLLDPQQRMLLEAAWEAKSTLRNIAADRAGVTVGISGNEYGRMADVVSAYTATGGAPQRRLRPHVVHLRSPGHQHGRRHGVLIVAGGIAHRHHEHRQRRVR